MDLGLPSRMIRATDLQASGAELSWQRPTHSLIVWVTLTINLSGRQELHPACHLETVANEIFYCQGSLPKVLHCRGEDGGGRGDGEEGKVTPLPAAQVGSFALRELRQTHFSPRLDCERVRWSAGPEDWRAEWAAAELSGPFGPPQSSVSPGSGF